MLKEKGIVSHRFSLINVRIVFLTVAFAHLIVTAIVMLSIDTTVDEDPKVKAYYHLRWKLMTCWFNLITLAYLPARLYSDFSTRQGYGDSFLVKQLNHATDVIMTGILFPVTLFADIMFWYMYTKDRTYLGPPRVFHYLPRWAQHSLHTVSMFVMFLDLMLTPRRRPSTLKPRIALLMTFSFIYIWVLYSSHSKGEILYPVIADCSLPQIACIVILSLASLLMLFAFQWVVIDLIWGKNPKKKLI